MRRWYEAVGWVFGEPVTQEMLATSLNITPLPAAVGDGPPAASRWAARAVMSAMLARQEAARRGLPTESDLPAAVADELVGDGAPPDAEVLAYFERNRHRYEQPEHRRVRHVLCEGEKQAGLWPTKRAPGQPLSAWPGSFPSMPARGGRVAT